MSSTDREVQILQNLVSELEQQLEEARNTIHILERHKQIEEQLRAAQDEASWLARLPGENPDPVVRVSNAGVVLYHNPPAAKLPGWTCTVNELLPVQLLPLIQKAIAQGKMVAQDVLLSERLYSVYVIPILGESYLNLYGTDITERKQIEKQLQVYAERLERSNQELEQFAFMASHDLQEPLRKIEMFGDLLLDEAEGLNERGRNYLQRMRSAAERMHAMVEGLLKLSRVTTQGQPFVRVNLSRVCSEVLSDLEDQIRRTNVRLDFSPLPAVDGDPLQLRQLMQNLIGNALKYHLPEKPPEVKVYAKQLSDKIQIFVEDKGIGFEQEDAMRIFQPFVRLVGRSQYEGSGMGLAICRRIVERHGGQITARSQPRLGTTFIVTLPIHHSESTRTA